MRRSVRTVGWQLAAVNTYWLSLPGVIRWLLFPFEYSNSCPGKQLGYQQIPKQQAALCHLPTNIQSESSKDGLSMMSLKPRLCSYHLEMFRNPKR